MQFDISVKDGFVASKEVSERSERALERWILQKNSTKRSAQSQVLFAADYSQQEIRILAHFSQDPNLMKCFSSQSTSDVYVVMASTVHRKPTELVTPTERSSAKQIVIAAIYGLSHVQIAAKLGISETAAKNLRANFFKSFPGIQIWIQRVIKNAARDGFVSTIAGRRRYLANIKSINFHTRSQAERQAVNTIIQGSASDITKFAMIRINERLETLNNNNDNDRHQIKARMILQIHDEVLFECEALSEQVHALKEMVVGVCGKETTEHFRLLVPLVLHCQIGTSYGQLRDCIA